VQVAAVTRAGVVAEIVTTAMRVWVDRVPEGAEERVAVKRLIGRGLLGQP
jgi:hypothetical protein